MKRNAAPNREKSKMHASLSNTHYTFAKEHDWEFDDDTYVSIIPPKCRWSSWAHDEDGKGLTADDLLDFVNNTLFPTLKNLPVDASTPIRQAIVQTTFFDANNYMKDGVLLRQVVNVIDELDFSMI